MTKEEGWAHAHRVIKRITPPSFPDHVFNILAYGAVGDGVTDCTDAFRQAIEDCSFAGGGRVLVPPGGVFLTGPIVLLSTINVHVSETATVLFKQDPSAYLPLVQTRWEGVELMNYSPLIYAWNQSNIAITGRGTLDGNANESMWWDWKYGPQDAGRRLLFQMATENVPVKDRKFGDSYFLRPSFVEPYLCTNILIEGVQIVNSPMWAIHPTLSDNIIVRGVSVDSRGPNNDGVDPESCRDVLIENSVFNTGDDCVAIKSGRGDDGRRLDRPSTNIFIRNCTMKDGHGGLSVGSEIAAGVQHVYAEDCHWNSPNLRYGFRIKSNPLFGGRAENIYLRNIRMNDVGRAAIRIDFKYEDTDRGQYMPHASNIFIQGVSSERSGFALHFDGLARGLAQNITIRNCTFLNVENHNIIKHIDGMVLDNVVIDYVPKSFGPVMVTFMFLFMVVVYADFVEWFGKRRRVYLPVIEMQDTDMKHYRRDRRSGKQRNRR